MKKNEKYPQFKIKSCRICGGSRLYKFLDLGSMPPPNGYLTKVELKQKEYHYPLDVCLCRDCFHVQLYHIVPSEIMFKNYLYIPSTSQTLLQNFASIASELVEKYHPKKGSLVIDIGSNDGTLLSYFKAKEMEVLGIDPATNLVTVARLKGVETINDFFSEKLARELVKKYGKAKIITATNSFAHINDLNNYCQGLNILLDKDGVAFLEFPYLLDLLGKNEFDTIYHEHLSYFSVLPLTVLFKNNNLKILDIVHTPIHGGSIRVYLGTKNTIYKPSNSYREFIKEEKLRKIDQMGTYDEFARRVKVIKRDLVAFLKRLKKQGKTIVGYGASAKGNVLLNYCGINKNIIDYVVDSIPFKQGRFTPGTHLPIYPEGRLLEDQPDYALLFSWTFLEEILNKQRLYRERGGQFIITIPYLRIE